MWELLKKIAELGWKPYGKDISELSETEKDIRLLTSRSSGLWQFVCENGMVKKPDIDRGEVHNWDNPNHWLCESALKDESELEDFLLGNIKVEG